MSAPRSVRLSASSRSPAEPPTPAREVTHKSTWKETTQESISRDVAQETVSPLSLAHSHHKQIQAFTKRFNRVYDQFYIRHNVDKTLLSEISNTAIAMDLFDKLTLGKQYQGRIALIDGKVRFTEIPLPPHGDVLGFLLVSISHSLGVLSPRAMLMPCSDNGMNTYFDYDANYEDIVLSPTTKKRPDASWRLERHLLPNPPPAWLQLDARGLPTASVVLEVAVDNESPTTLQEDCHAYFGVNTSTTVWVGVKIWLAGCKFWVGWAERAPNGVGAVGHSQMQWVPNYSSFLVPCNIIYQIPMQTVFGQGIAIPPGIPATLDINVEAIRDRIVRSV